MRNAMTTSWLERAALYELLALGFRYPTDVLIEAVTKGEFSEALEELATCNEIDPGLITTSLEELQEYKGLDPVDLLHTLRVEYTALFIGEKEPLVSPYAGIWWSHERDIPPLLFVNKESRAVKHFMRSCGIGQPEDANEPLDHIATELEFLHYLCLLRSDAAVPLELPEGLVIPEQAYEAFYEKHFITWNKEFSTAVLEHARIPFYRSLAHVLGSYR